MFEMFQRYTFFRENVGGFGNYSYLRSQNNDKPIIND